MTPPTPATEQPVGNAHRHIVSDTVTIRHRDEAREIDVSLPPPHLQEPSTSSFTSSSADSASTFSSPATLTPETFNAPISTDCPSKDAPESPVAPHRKRKLSSTQHALADPVRLSPARSFSASSSPESQYAAVFDNPAVDAPTPTSALSPASTIAVDSASPGGASYCDVVDVFFSPPTNQHTRPRHCATTNTDVQSTIYHDDDQDIQDCSMTTTPSLDPDAAPSVPTSQAPFFDPSNPLAQNPACRSQSPAKRLKSDDLLQTVVGADLVDTPEPMDEDTVTTCSSTAVTSATVNFSDTPAAINSRGVSVEMPDVEPEATAGPVVDSGPDAPVVDSGPDAPEGPLSASTTLSVTPELSASSAATSVLTPTFSVEEQVQMVKDSKFADMKEGDDWYVISGKWLKRFMAQLPEYIKEVSKEELERDITPIDNSDLVDTAQLEGIILEAGTADDFVPIKDLQVGEDLEILPADAWNRLVSWYGLAKDSPVITRKVVNTAEERGAPPNYTVELTPSVFTVYRLRDPGAAISKDSLQKEKLGKPKKLVTAKSEGFQQFLAKVKALAGIDRTRKIRLWQVSTPEEVLEKGSKKSKTPGTLKQMVLDLQTFLAMEGRSCIEIKDNTTNGKYNGNSARIGTIGLHQGGTIVIEEQSSDGEWITDIHVKTANKFGEVVSVAKQGFGKSATTTKKKLPQVSARSTSPNPTVIGKPSSSLTSTVSSVFTRGREKRDGRTRGTCGLSNLGNTCYMNSALQCLRSVQELSEYFLTNEYMHELNPQNPLAHHGMVAKAYAGLLNGIFNQSSPQAFPPREFKSTIGKFGPSFSGYGQQDSQEFLAFLLDGMHEDLNRIMNKPYTEKPDSTDEMVGNPDAIAKLAERHWDIYKKRNDSAVADLFAGLYKSTLVCPTCQKVSITFDPFMDLTLPLPVESFWNHDICWFPKDFESPLKTSLVKVPVELPKQSGIASLKEYVGKKFGVDPKKIMVSEVYKDKFFKHYEDNNAVSDIGSGDEIYMYELEDVPTNWPGPKKRSMLYIDEPETTDADKLLVPVAFRKTIRSGRRYGPSFSVEPCQVPFFIVLTKEEASDYVTILQKVVERAQFFTTYDLYAEPHVEEEEDDASGEIVNASEGKDRPDVLTEGFVDVSMNDAASAAGSEEVDRQPISHVSGRRKVPHQTESLFTLKYTKKNSSGGFPDGSATIDAGTELFTRFQPTQIAAPEPRSSAPEPRSSVLFGDIIARNTGRAQSPASNVSDEDNLYGDPIEREDSQEDMMHDASDDENTTYSQSDMMGAFQAPDSPPTFYGNGNNSSLNVLGPSPAPSINNGALVRSGEGIVIELTEEGFDTIFGGKSPDDFRGVTPPIRTLDDAELRLRRQRREQKKKNGLHLEDCLDEFAKEEILSSEDPWFCPRCKEHRRASKKFELWKCPDILVIHLKRFSSSRSFRDKIDVTIDCPIEGLDLTNRVGVTDGKRQIYDLIAVDNHYGGLGGGHYTAAVKNWFDGEWYNCDDSSVSRKNSNSVVTSAAYLLFYRRRSEKPLGGPQFERILDSSARISAAAAAEAEEEDQDDELAELAPEAEDDYDSMPSRGMLIGPAPPPKTPFSAYHGTVGNSTLWGGSMPAVKSSEDPGELPGYEDIDGGVTLEEDEGVEIEDPKQLFVGAAGGVLEAEDEGVQEVRLGEERVV